MIQRDAQRTFVCFHVMRQEEFAEQSTSQDAKGILLQLYRGGNFPSLLTQLTGPRFTQYSYQFTPKVAVSSGNPFVVSLAHLSGLVCPLTPTKFLVPAAPCPSPALLASPASPDPCPPCFLLSLAHHLASQALSLFSQPLLPEGMAFRPGSTR